MNLLDLTALIETVKHMNKTQLIVPVVVATVADLLSENEASSKSTTD